MVARLNGRSLRLQPVYVDFDANMAYRYENGRELVFIVTSEIYIRQTWKGLEVPYCVLVLENSF